MTPLVTRRARRHLEEIAEYISERNPSAGRHVGARIREIIDLLGTFPYMGREGALTGTREMVVPGLPYIVVYRVSGPDPTVEIVGVYHGAQRRPGQEPY
jgi:plasmid stabilization system protein ParE